MASDSQSSSYWHILSVLGTAIVSVLGTVYFMRRGPPGIPSSPNLAIGLLTDTIGYLPHIMLLFGVIADAVTQDGVYSIASLIGLLSIFVNWAMSFFWTAVGDIVTSLRELVSNSGSFEQSGPSNPIRDAAALRRAQQRTMAGGGKPGDFSGNYDGCDVQGFSALHSKYAPQTLVVTATIFSYYLFDLISNRGWAHAGTPFAVFLVLFLAQVGVIGECSVEELGRWSKAAVAAVEGIFFGGTSYAIVQAYFPKWLPSSAIPVLPRVSSDELKPGANGTLVDSSGNPYVCMPNGQCLPDLSSADARKNFADMAAENLGTGKPATPADCPASGAPRT